MPQGVGDGNNRQTSAGGHADRRGKPRGSMREFLCEIMPVRRVLDQVPGGAVCPGVQGWGATRLHQTSATHTRTHAG
jgi:hypothetical protein